MYQYLNDFCFLNEYLNEIQIWNTYEISKLNNTGSKFWAFDFFSSAFSLIWVFPTMFFLKKKILSPLIFGSLRGNLVLVEGIFSRISRKEQDSAPTLHTKENPGWRFFKEVTYAKYENGLKILRWWEFWLNRLFSWGGVGVWGSAPPPPPHPMTFLKTLHIKTDVPHWALPH